MINLLQQPDPASNLNKELPHLMFMNVVGVRGADRVATPTNPGLPQRAKASVAAGICLDRHRQDDAS